MALFFGTAPALPQGRQAQGKKTTINAKKFTDIKDPLELERELDEFAPTPQQKLSALKAFYNTQINKYDPANDGNTKALPYRQCLAQLEKEQEEHRITSDFMSGWWRWMLGRGSDEDHAKTPWGRIPLYHDPEVRAYIDFLIDKKFEFEAKMMLLRARGAALGGLDGLNAKYLYYKYIVKQDSVDVDKIEFLRDWETLLKDDPEQLQGSKHLTMYDHGPRHPRHPAMKWLEEYPSGEASRQLSGPAAFDPASIMKKAGMINEAEIEAEMAQERQPGGHFANRPNAPDREVRAYAVKQLGRQTADYHDWSTTRATDSTFAAITGQWTPETEDRVKSARTFGTALQEFRYGTPDAGMYQPGSSETSSSYAESFRASRHNTPAGSRTSGSQPGIGDLGLGYLDPGEVPTESGSGRSEIAETVLAPSEHSEPKSEPKSGEFGLPSTMERLYSLGGYIDPSDPFRVPGYKSPTPSVFEQSYLAPRELLTAAGVVVEKRATSEAGTIARQPSSETSSRSSSSVSEAGTAIYKGKEEAADTGAGVKISVQGWVERETIADRTSALQKAQEQYERYNDEVEKLEEDLRQQDTRNRRVADAEIRKISTQLHPDAYQQRVKQIYADRNKGGRYEETEQKLQEARDLAAQYYAAKVQPAKRALNYAQSEIEDSAKKRHIAASQELDQEIDKRTDILSKMRALENITRQDLKEKFHGYTGSSEDSNLLGQRVRAKLNTIEKYRDLQDQKTAQDKKVKEAQKKADRTRKELDNVSRI